MIFCCCLGDKDLVECMKGAIRKHYGPNRAVGMGGTFLVKQGSIKIHVMPDFSETPLTCDEEVTDWLKFYEVSWVIRIITLLVKHCFNPLTGTPAF